MRPAGRQLPIPAPGSTHFSYSLARGNSIGCGFSSSRSIYHGRQRLGGDPPLHYWVRSTCSCLPGCGHLCQWKQLLLLAQKCYRSSLIFMSRSHNRNAALCFVFSSQNNIIILLGLLCPRKPTFIKCNDASLMKVWDRKQACLLLVLYCKVCLNVLFGYCTHNVHLDFFSVQ